MSNAAVIVAAGRGNRAGGEIPKQWQGLRGKPIAEWTLATFISCPLISHIVLVVHSDDAERAANMLAGRNVILATGGETRDASVRAGLDALNETDTTQVLIHDVARPLVTHALIGRVIAALDTSLAAAPGLAVTDAIWTGHEDRVSGTQDRTGLFRAQTPQGFDFQIIRGAHQQAPTGALDDVEVARAAGIDVTIVPGDESNIKITTAADFERAKTLMGTDLDIRVGNGFDVHRFGDGDSVILCGVSLPHERGLQGHSDADVGMHALTDAIYGALALGDIGRHFPPSDPKWKGAESRIFLEHAVQAVRSRGYEISNVDVTLICEVPKIGPHAAAMSARLGEIMGVLPDRISVKATTSERLGFTGRGEGIAANATATLVKS